VLFFFWNFFLLCKVFLLLWLLSGTKIQITKITNAWDNVLFVIQMRVDLTCDDFDGGVFLLHHCNAFWRSNQIQKNDVFFWNTMIYFIKIDLGKKRKFRFFFRKKKKQTFQNSHSTTSRTTLICLKQNFFTKQKHNKIKFKMLPVASIGSINKTLRVLMSIGNFT